MTEERSNREVPAQMQNALDWLKRESGRGYDVERGLASLEDTLGSSVSGRGAASLPARSHFGWKVGGMIGIGALLGIVGYTTMSAVPEGQRAGDAVPVPAFIPASASASPSGPDSPAPIVPNAASTGVTVESLPTSAVVSSTTGSRSPRSVVATPAARPAPPPSEDAAHAELVHAARLRALAAVDPSAALREAAEGDRLFARGVLGEEREAIAIGALAKLGRMQEVRARASRYLAAHPTGPLAEEVRQLAGAGSGSSPKESP